MTFIIGTLLVVGGFSFALGLLSGRPGTVGSLLVALSLLWLFIKSPIGPIGPGMAVLCAAGAVAGALVAYAVRAARPV